MKICAVVSNIRYRHDSGWAVVDLVDSTNLRFVAVGTMPTVYEGERLELEGEWTVHKTYGKQFAVSSYTSVAPSEQDAVFKYLSSGLIRGVGEHTARAMLAQFGEDTLSIIENEPQRLAEVPGIGKVRSQMIHESFMEKRSVQQIFIGLQELGITMNQANKLYKLYGAGVVQRIKENPYKLIEDVESIGFKTADKIAQNAGFEHDSPFRVRAGIRHMLNTARGEGNTCVPKGELIYRTCELLGVETALTESIVEQMILSSDLVEQHFLDNDFIFLPYLHYAEIDSAVRLNELLMGASLLPMTDVEGEIAALERRFGIELADMQRRAVSTALSEGVMVITGGPGTGKTTILLFIIELMESMGLTVELAAPTGRAAKRISDTTGREARTLHRLLEFGFDTEAFARCEDYPIEADVVIVDEMSMVDVPLFHALLRAVPRGTRLIMVGDHDQLPSVGPGNVLRDIINAGTVPVIRLTEIYRQAGRSMIVINAHRINHGQTPVVDRNESDFIFIPREGMEDTLQTVVSMCTEFADTGSEGDFQVLAPMKQNILGVFNLNEKLQYALNPPAPDKAERQYGEVIFRVGDRVMQTRNNYKMEWKRSRRGKKDEDGAGVYNGDIGTVMRIDRSASTVEILFDDERLASYSQADLEDIELAYAISIHKSQGSEFSTVILPLVYGPPMLMNRNILYTAVTRARSRVYIVGTAKCVESMVRSRMSARRYSGMEQFMRRLAEQFDE